MANDTTTLDGPPDTDDEFDFASLDPANLLKSSVGEQVELPPREGAPEPDPTPTLTGDGVTPPAPAPITPTPATPDGKPEGVNMRKLRELREAAETRARELEEQNKTLAQKLAELEPRAQSYETERERLQRAMEEKEEQVREAHVVAWRVSARERADWKERADAIRGAAAAVEQIVALPELREAGLNHPVEALLSPTNRSALNEVIRVLNEHGKYSEAQELIDSNRAVNAWRGELRRIEESAAEEARAWQTKREESAGSVVQNVRSELARANPIHDTRSPEFLALPEEQRQFLLGQHAAAEQAAREVLSKTTKPQELVAETYKTQLSLRLYQQAHAGMSSQLAAAQKEMASLKARLEAYEKAAGGAPGSGGGGGGGQRATDPDDPAELARMLDPRNMPSYRGL